ncbi:acetyl esterase/lipase [Pseudoduganella lurida]|uniref:Acetyl esterase/lipase n=1 Tax=Pseudoduganella lurida TaxID=1036180 RepID=A0A562RNR7_9BURK|nr:alpha/beta hydrolase [Pseudoduganella lurida]TWI70050.1 acetyl esterase/lipase [Pseudoduganella lurida]
MTKLLLDEHVIQAVRRFNGLLARMPRFKIRNRFTPRLIQSLLRMSQLGADRKLARANVRVEQHIAKDGGLSVPVRVLRPAGAACGVVLDLHGGGWVIGNPQMNDALNAALVADCQVTVVSVDYRLVPRFPLQAAMDDCLAAARWLLAGGPGDVDGLPVFFVGESAGAHLAGTVLLRLKDQPQCLERVAGAVLYYGVYDLAGTPKVHAADATTLVLDGPGMAEALRMLTPGFSDAERRAAPHSPLYGDLAGMPPALMYGGERDPLLDDTTSMAQRWRAVADVELHVLPEAPHGFLHFPTPLGRVVQLHTHAWIRQRISVVHNDRRAGVTAAL